jgi:hypothetical protein
MGEGIIIARFFAGQPISQEDGDFCAAPALSSRNFV